MRVYSYQLGSSQSFGQDPQYFPYNVLGEICTSATPTNPCADPCQVVSLGKGGFIALEFDPPIADGPGPDFTVFENPFRYGSGQVFDEWMIVSVSQDGINWVVFPFDSITGQGLAGRTPTGCMGCSGPINWQDPSQSGGDAFDLSVVGLAWAKYVRVTDATSWQPPDRLSADLDGIVAIHQLSSNSLAYQIGPTGVTIRSLVQPLFEAWNLLGQPISAEVREIGEGTWIIRPFGPAVVRIYTPTGMQQVKGFFAPMD
ncbi:MAG: hypothetical protein N3E49_00290 [Bacteroidia bacterium]|nr:hypothetical protein [Bacteroidia bacterium]